MAGGEFLRQNEFTQRENLPEVRLQQEFERAQHSWEPLSHALFGGSPTRAAAAFNSLLTTAAAWRHNYL